MQWHWWSRALEDSRRSVATWCHHWPCVARGVRRDVARCLRCLCQGTHSGLLSLSSPSVCATRSLHQVRQALVHLRSKPAVASTISNHVACGVQSGRCENGGCINRFKMKAFRSIRKTADRLTISGQLQRSNWAGRWQETIDTTLRRRCPMPRSA
jgi:hypothetical protein